MGVRFLETFITKSVEGGVIQDVDILNEINQWKIDHGGSSPIIVFDIMGFLKSVCFHTEEVFFNGRHHLLNEMNDRFLANLKSNGASLTFFCDGKLQISKLDVWLKRRNTGYESNVNIFNEISDGTPTEKLVQNLEKLNSLRGSINSIDAFIDICKRYGKFHTSIDNECDKELAQYATKNNAMAVIAQDTDFLIFEGDWKYWSATAIDLQDFTTVEYSREALRNRLGLNAWQMPLFASLSGNDFIPFDRLKQFHYKLGPFKKKFDKLAEYVKTFTDHPLISSQLKQIARKCFYMPKHTDVELLQESLKSYDLNFDFVMCDGINFDCYITNTLCVSAYFDMTRTDFMPYIDIFLPIIRRKMGIVLQHKNDIYLTKPLFTKLSHDEPYQQITVYPEYPRVRLPPLTELTNEDDQNANPQRFRLFIWAVTGNDCSPLVQRVQSIPMGYLAASLAIFYLVRTNQITVKEADAILVSIDDVNRGSVKRDIIYPKTLDARTVIICHLYPSVHTEILECLQLCGLSKFMDQLVFDGVHFYNLAMEFRNDQEDTYLTTATEQIRNIREILFPAMEHDVNKY